MLITFIPTKSSTTTKAFVYKDLDLSLKQNNPSNYQLEKQRELNDVNAIYDMNSVFNSLTTLFNTRPGEKPLNPRYGLYLQSYLFEPITDGLNQTIGNKIISAIKEFEPRVTVTSVSVSADGDQQELNISIMFYISGLEATVSATINTTTEGTTISA